MMTIKELLNNIKTVQGSKDGVHWFPVRPQTMDNTFLRYRIKHAWNVLIGKADAIYWSETK